MRFAWLTAVALLALSLVPGVAPWLADRLPGNGNAGFPQRVGFIRGAPMLPAKPGPLALIVTDNNFGDGAWEAVSPSGRAWRLLMPAPHALSDDGRWLAAPTRGGIEIRDLVAGTSTTWSPSGHAERARPVAWVDAGHTLLATTGGYRGHPALIDLDTGQIATSDVMGQPIGVTADGAVVAITRSDTSMSVVLLPPGLREARRSTLYPTGGWAGPHPTVATLTPTGDIVLPDRGPKGLLLRTFTLDGQETSQLATDIRLSNYTAICALRMRGDDPVITTKSYGSQAQVRQVHPDGSATQLLAIHHRMQSNCVTFAADALEAGPQWSLLGANDAIWTWYWRPLLLILLLTAGPLGWSVVSRRRRSSPS